MRHYYWWTLCHMQLSFSYTWGKPSLEMRYEHMLHYFYMLYAMKLSLKYLNVILIALSYKAKATVMNK